MALYWKAYMIKLKHASNKDLLESVSTYVSSNNLSDLKILLRNNPTLNLDSTDYNFLHVAIKNDNKEMVILLLQYGASIEMVCENITPILIKLTKMERLL